MKIWYVTTQMHVIADHEYRSYAVFAPTAEAAIQRATSERPGSSMAGTTTYEISEYQLRFVAEILR